MEIDILDAIQKVGFPIAVAVFALIRLDVTMRANTKVLTAISTKLGLNDAEVNK